jgi:hypothetical protein
VLEGVRINASIAAALSASARRESAAVAPLAMTVQKGAPCATRLSQGWRSLAHGGHFNLGVAAISCSE